MRYVRSKYNAKPQIIDGIHFDSTAESKRYSELKLMEKAGAIRDLKVHPTFPIEVNGQRICRYEADFSYFDVLRGTIITEDVKGMKTALYNIKKKLVRACYGVEIHEVRA